MNAAYNADLAQLKHLAFRRVEACGELLKRFHRLPKAVKMHDSYVLFEKIRGWLLTPFTLWPVDFIGLANHFLCLIESGKKPGVDVKLLLELISECPCVNEQQTIGKYEHNVQAGDYTSLITAQPKFAHKQKMLFENPIFRDDWKKLKAHFDLSRYRDKKGIIRRRMAQERSFRPEGWQFRWGKSDDRFRIVFDAFCHKWFLYGMAGERPLLQMLSVNVTPFVNGKGATHCCPAVRGGKNLGHEEILCFSTSPRTAHRPGPTRSTPGGV